MATITLNQSGEIARPAVIVGRNSISSNRESLKYRQILSTVIPESTFPIITIADVLNNSDIGVWSYDLLSNRLQVCNKIRGFLGIDENVQLTRKSLFRKLIELRQVDFLRVAGFSCLENKKIEEELHFYNPENQSEKWLKVNGQIYSEGLNSPRMVGTIIDITANKLELQRQKDLMALLCHELKNPLSILKLYVQFFNKKMVSQQISSGHDMLKNCDGEIINMTNLINNFLSLSLIENSKMELTTSQFDIKAVLDDVITVFSVLHPDYQFKINLSEDIIIIADKDKIRQVLFNYINNAVKYSPHNRLITISCKQQNEQLIISVSDNGIGISEKNQKTLFTRFGRIQDNRSFEAKGFGLGLFLSKKIIESHSGRVWVKSMPNRGSDFYFSLPL